MTAAAASLEDLEMNFDDMDDDDEYVPDSLKGFLTELDSNLEEMKKDVLGGGSSSVAESDTMVFDDTIANSHSTDTAGNTADRGHDDDDRNRDHDHGANGDIALAASEDDELISKSPASAASDMVDDIGYEDGAGIGIGLEEQLNAVAEENGEHGETYYDKDDEIFFHIVTKADPPNSQADPEPEPEPEPSPRDSVGADATVDMSDLFSPGATGNHHANPAAHLTASQAKEMALEGATPAINRNVDLASHPIPENSGDMDVDEPQFFSPVINQTAHNMANAARHPNADETKRPTSINLQTDMDEASDIHSPQQGILPSLSTVSTTPLASKKLDRRQQKQQLQSPTAAAKTPKSSGKKKNIFGLLGKAKVAPADLSSPSSNRNSKKETAPPSSPSVFDRLTRGTASSEARSNSVRKDQRQKPKADEQAAAEELRRAEEEEKQQQQQAENQRRAEMEQRRQQNLERKKQQEQQERRRQAEIEKRRQEEQEKYRLAELEKHRILEEKKREEELEKKRALEEENRRQHQQQIERQRIEEEKKRQHQQQIERQRMEEMEKKLREAEEERRREAIVMERRRKEQEERELAIRKEQEALEQRHREMELQRQRLEKQRRAIEEEERRQLEMQEAMKERLARKNQMMQQQQEANEISLAVQMETMAISQPSPDMEVDIDAAMPGSAHPSTNPITTSASPPSLPAPPSFEEFPELPGAPTTQTLTQQEPVANDNEVPAPVPTQTLRRPADKFNDRPNSVPLVVTTETKVVASLPRPSSRGSSASDLTEPRVRPKSQLRQTREKRPSTAKTSTKSAPPRRSPTSTSGDFLSRMMRSTASSSAKHATDLQKPRERQTAMKTRPTKIAVSQPLRVRARKPRSDPPESSTRTSTSRLSMPTASSSNRLTNKSPPPPTAIDVRNLVRARMSQSSKPVAKKPDPKAKSRTSVKDALELARMRRDKAERERLDRIERLRKEREDRLASIEEAKKKQRVRPKPQMPKKVSGFKPTVPVGPKFATDSRFGKRDPVAKSPSRNPNSSPSKSPSNPPQLAVSEGPKLATSIRHPSKSPPKSNAGPKPVPDSWEVGLRSSSASTTSRTPSLTVPQTPKFSKIRRRELPKSTAEKEKEEMEFYKSHPFKAHPVRMNAAPSSLPKPPKSNKQLTTCEPFNLRTESRAGKSHQKIDEKMDVEPSQHTFRATPMPDFSKTKNIPLTGKTPDPQKRKLTQPEPFHFVSDKRCKSESFDRDVAPTPSPQFKARPMPNFSRPPNVAYDSGGRIHQRIHQKTEPPNETSPFKARPMPDFSPRVPVNPIIHSNKPVTTPSPFKFHTNERAKKSAEKESEPGPSPPEFRARPAPHFTRPAIPITPRQPSKIRSPAVHTQDKDNPEKEPVKLFRARPAPTFTAPSINVKGRDPTRLRSPELVSRPTEKKEVKKSSTSFKARKVPTFVRRRARELKLQIDAPNGQSPTKARIRSTRSGSNSMQSPGKNSVSNFSSSNVRHRLNKVMANSPAAQGRVNNRDEPSNGVPMTITLRTPQRQEVPSHEPAASGMDVDLDAFEEHPRDVYAFQEPVITPRTSPEVPKTFEDRLLERPREMQQTAVVVEQHASSSAQVEPSEEQLSRELQAATEKWEAAQAQEARRTEELRRAREASHRIQMSRQRDALEMAYQLERAADDELSFGTRDRVAPSINSRNQYTISSQHSTSVFQFYRPEDQA